MDLKKIHGEFDRWMSDRQGWARFVGHFIMFAFPFVATGWAGEEYNLFGPHILLILSWPAAAVGFAVIVWMEVRDVQNKKHDLKKAKLDFASKLSGLATGLLTWILWYV